MHRQRTGRRRGARAVTSHLSAKSGLAGLSQYLNGKGS